MVHNRMFPRGNHCFSVSRGFSTSARAVRVQKEATNVATAKAVRVNGSTSSTSNGTTSSTLGSSATVQRCVTGEASAVHLMMTDKWLSVEDIKIDLTTARLELAKILSTCTSTDQQRAHLMDTDPLVVFDFLENQIPNAVRGDIFVSLGGSAHTAVDGSSVSDSSFDGSASSTSPASSSTTRVSFSSGAGEIINPGLVASKESIYVLAEVIDDAVDRLNKDFVLREYSTAYKLYVMEKLITLQNIIRCDAVLKKEIELPKSTFLAFIEKYGNDLSEIEIEEEKESDIAFRITEIRNVIDSFMRMKYDITEKMKPLYRYIEDVPVHKIDPRQAVITARDLLEKRWFSGGAIQTLLHAAVSAGEMVFIRQLKLIELLLSLDQSETKGELSVDLQHFLDTVHNWKYTPPRKELDITEDPVLYQVSHFLRKHGFPCVCASSGPYAMALADPDNKIAIMREIKTSVDRFTVPVYKEGDDPTDRPVFEENMRRHLRLQGWTIVEINQKFFSDLSSYKDKANFIRALLKTNRLLKL